jgi:hypothetical protein
MLKSSVKLSDISYTVSHSVIHSVTQCKLEKKENSVKLRAKLHETL